MILDNNLFNNFEKIGIVNIQFNIDTQDSLIIYSEDDLCEKVTIEYLKEQSQSLLKKFEAKNFTLFTNRVEKGNVTLYITVIPIYTNSRITDFSVLSDYTKNFFSNEEIKTLLDMANHDIMNSLALINVANDRLLTRADENFLPYCNIIKENIYKIIKYNNSSKDLMTLYLSNDTENQKNTEISSFVKTHCDEIQKIVEDIDINFESKGNCYSFVNTSLLSSALINLLSNAVKYKTKDSKIDVLVYKTYTYVKIMISNTTSHVDEKNIKKIFNLGYTTADNKEINGSGQGLYLVKKIAEYHGGKIMAKLNQNLFTVTLFLPNSKIRINRLSSYTNNIDLTNIKAYFNIL